MGRSALRVRRTEGQRNRHRSRDHRVLPRPDVRLQDAEVGGVRADTENLHRQNPEIHAAQPGQLGEGDFGLINSGAGDTRRTHLQRGAEGYRNTIIAATCLGLVWFGDAVIYVVLPLYALSFGFDAVTVGVLLSVNRVVRILGYGWVAPLARAYGTNVLTAAACAAGALSTFAYGLLSGFVLLFVARMIWGAAWGIINLTMIAYAYGDGKGAAGMRIGTRPRGQQRGRARGAGRGWPALHRHRALPDVRALWPAWPSGHPARISVAAAACRAERRTSRAPLDLDAPERPVLCPELWRRRRPRCDHLGAAGRVHAGGIGGHGSGPAAGVPAPGDHRAGAFQRPGNGSPRCSSIAAAMQSRGRGRPCHHCQRPCFFRNDHRDFRARSCWRPPDRCWRPKRRRIELPRWHPLQHGATSVWPPEPSLESLAL